jgi:hypothetical protein
MTKRTTTEMNHIKEVRGCRHKKKDGCIWCYECGAKRAGTKPKKTFEVGWFAIDEDHDMDYPGRVAAVQINLLGLAVEHPCWSEEVVIVNGHDQWRGPADRVTRLVAVVTEED